MNSKKFSKKLGAPPADTSANSWEAIYQADDAGWDMGEASPPLLSFIEEGILPKVKTKVLVVGCGTGHELPVLVQEGYDTVGADFAPSAVNAARAKLKRLKQKNHQVFKVDLLEPSSKLPDHSFNWIFDQTFFCALVPNQREAYAESMKRLLKKGGEIWALNIRTQYKERQPYDCTPNRYIKLMEKYGFELIEKRKLKKESHPRRAGRETLIRMKSVGK